MRRFIFCLLILVAAVWIGVNIAADPGYILIAYRQWTAEMPLWFGGLALLLLFFLLYYLLRLIKNIKRLPRKIRNWKARRRAQANQRLTNQGLLALAAGKWVEAEKKLLKATPANDIAWLNYLAAARAAYERGDKERYELYLQQAVQQTKAAEIAVGIEQVQFQLGQQQYEQAMAILQRLHQMAPKQNYVLRQLIQLCAQLADWPSMLNLLFKARKQKAFSEDKFLALETQAYQGLLAKELNSELDLQTIKELWHSIPRNLKDTPTLVHGYAKLLVSRGEHDEAEKLIRTHLNKIWSDPLAYEYGLVTSSKTDSQLNYAEKWLREHEHNAVLLLTLGRLCIRNQLWGKARSYLETSIAIVPRPETYHELAKLFEKLNDRASAFQAYQAGLALVVK